MTENRNYAEFKELLLNRTAWIQESTKACHEPGEDSRRPKTKRRIMPTT